MMMFRKTLIFCVFAFCVTLFVNAKTVPISYDYDQNHDSTAHRHGRVQIKVFRGPSSHHDHHHFAPHGYWIKQPADDHY